MFSEKFRRIKDEATRSGRPYEDPEFPASSSSLTFQGLWGQDLEWRRPQDIEDNAKFIVGGAKYDDITQGQLGNCWFISVVATIATDEVLFKRVVPDQELDQTGVVCFYFWYDGEWKEIIIDDRLPTSKRGRLIYCKNHAQPNEFWCPLLEKAYAKLYSCYGALDGGLISEALVDLTGGIGETLNLPPKPTNEYVKTMEHLSAILLKCTKMNTMLGAGIINRAFWTDEERSERKYTKLMDEHAYSIIKIVEIEYKYDYVTLLLMRDPNARNAGHMEWNGAWSENSDEWNHISLDIKRKLEYSQDLDGQFWISVKDFVKQFDYAYCTHLTPDALTSELALDPRKQEWEVRQFTGSWVKYISSGGKYRDGDEFWTNPQFKIIKRDMDPSKTVIISLARYLSADDLRKNKKVYISFEIFKLKDGVDVDRLYDERNAIWIRTFNVYITPMRDMVFRFELEAGTYFVIPFTRDKGMEANFILRIFTEKTVNVVSVDEDTGPIELPEQPSEPHFIEELFEKYSDEETRSVNAFGLQQIISEAKKREYNGEDGFTLETSRCLIALYFASHPGKTEVGKHATERIWKFIHDLKVTLLDFEIVNASRKVKLSDLRFLYKKLNFNMSVKLLAAISKRYGTSDGLISEEDFIQSCAKVISLYKNFNKIVNTGNDDVSKLIVAAMNA